MLNIPITLENQINQLADQAGQPIELFLEKVIADYLDDSNDIAEADVVYQRIQSCQETTLSFTQVMQENGLDD
jgi:predicted DNA-binding protein